MNERTTKQIEQQLPIEREITQTKAMSRTESKYFVELTHFVSF